LQLRLDASFLSGDVDLFTDEKVGDLITSLGLGEGQSDPHIDVVPERIFIVDPGWRNRGTKEVFGNVTVYAAGDLDVLVGKVKRLEPKDLRAFDLVKAKTGGPTERVLLQALQNVVDMYRPAFDEDNSGGDATVNTRILWQHLFGRDIDVRKEIIAPALEARKKFYGGGLQKDREILNEISRPAENEQTDVKKSYPVALQNPTPLEAIRERNLPEASSPPSQEDVSKRTSLPKPKSEEEEIG